MEGRRDRVREERAGRSTVVRKKNGESLIGGQGDRLMDRKKDEETDTETGKRNKEEETNRTTGLLKCE